MEPFKGLVTAFRTLSILPVPGKDAEDYSSALNGFVWVGLVLGTLLYVLAFGLYRLIGNQWSEGLALVVVVGGVLLTRGFHLDGLADFADGFWGGYTKERTLAIMKDSSLGTFGVVALVVTLLAKWIALVRLFELSDFIWIVSAYVISRTMLVELTVALPYAREQGTAGPFIRGAGQRHRFVALVAAAVILFLINGTIGIAVLAIVWSLCRVFGMWCLKRVGGITGDLLGACSELSETLVLFLAVFYLLLKSTYF
jgi:adenosylcobinamide-GDP ribazoletransferase